MPLKVYGPNTQKQSTSPPNNQRAGGMLIVIEI